MGKRRVQWQSTWGFLLPAVGAAIGLGNIWRFSYMAYKNGGGAFLIPYLIALLTVGIPLLLLEFALSHKKAGSAPLAYRSIQKRWEWLGWIAVTIVMFAIVPYYMVVIAWCLNFFFLSFELAWGSDPNAFFFNKFLVTSEDPYHVGMIRPRIFISVLFVWLFTSFVVYRGVNKGIEWTNKIFMPLLFILTMGLVLWSLNLKGAMKGIEAYLVPDFSRLIDPAVWFDAYSQIFFTLSLGFGVMIVYASYLPKKSNLSQYAFATAFINGIYSFFTGLAIFSVLGYM